MSKIVPPVGWFGGMLISRHLLMWTKSSQEDETFNNPDSFISKMNRENWIARVQAILFAVNAVGPTVEAAEFIQKCKFFTDVSVEALAEHLSNAIIELGNGGIFKFCKGEFGTLDFSQPIGVLPEINDDCDNGSDM